MPEEEFDWDDGNIAHLTLHGILPEEAEQVVRNAPVSWKSSNDLESFVDESLARRTEVECS